MRGLPFTVSAVGTISEGLHGNNARTKQLDIPIVFAELEGKGIFISMSFSGAAKRNVQFTLNRKQNYLGHTSVQNMRVVFDPNNASETLYSYFEGSAYFATSNAPLSHFAHFLGATTGSRAERRRAIIKNAMPAPSQVALNKVLKRAGF